MKRRRKKKKILTCSHQFINLWGTSFWLFHPISFLQQIIHLWEVNTWVWRHPIGGNFPQQHPKGCKEEEKKNNSHLSLLFFHGMSPTSLVYSLKQSLLQIFMSAFRGWDRRRTGVYVVFYKTGVGSVGAGTGTAGCPHLLLWASRLPLEQADHAREAAVRDFASPQSR